MTVRRKSSSHRGSIARYTQKQKHQVEHIAKKYRAKGFSAREAIHRAWATINKMGRDLSKKAKTARRSVAKSVASATKKGHPLNRFVKGRSTTKRKPPSRYSTTSHRRGSHSHHRRSTSTRRRSHAKRR